MQIRLANESDSQDIFKWRNDPITRAMSFNNDPVSWGDHSTWYANSLRNPARKIYIATLNDASIGMCRFDLGHETLVSINLNPAYRGKGLATTLLTYAIQQANLSKLKAEIKKENIASIKAFEKSGFIQTSASKDYFIYTTK